jgi:hypothetical protein
MKWGDPKSDTAREGPPPAFNQFDPAGAFHQEVYGSGFTGGKPSSPPDFDSNYQRYGVDYNHPRFPDHFSIRDYSIGPLFRSSAYVKATADALFEQADLDKDGKLNVSEAQAASQDSNLPLEQRYLAQLCKNINRLAEDPDNELNFKADGATKIDIIRAFAGIADFRYLAPKARQIEDFGPRMFSSLDVDGNGFLTMHEIDYQNIPRDEYWMGREAFEATDAMKVVNPFIVHAHDDGENEGKGISIDDIKNSNEFIKKKYGAWAKVFSSL